MSPMKLEDLLVFEPMPKVPRLFRKIIITEKIDGTNASVHITDDGHIKAASRTRWITPQDDNHGFARWVTENKQELLKLGPGHHFGEWWGKGINRGYGLDEKRFSLFNVSRWDRAIFEENEEMLSTHHNPPPRKEYVAPPPCCGVVPVLYRGPFVASAIDGAITDLLKYGSYAQPGYRMPEGIMVYHTAAGQLFKRTILNDETPKSGRYMQ